MRLWHKDLIRVLPKDQLISQWRECIAVARRIELYGSPRHGLVNKVMDYPISHLYFYTDLFVCELFNRGYKVSPMALKKFEDIMIYIIDKKRFPAGIYSGLRTVFILGLFILSLILMAGSTYQPFLYQQF